MALARFQKQKRVADGKLQSPKKRKGEAKKASKVEEGKGRSKTRGRPSKKGKGKEDGVDKVVEVTPSIMDQPLTGALPVPSTQSQVKPITPQQVEDILLFTVNANTYLHKLQAERGAR